MNAYDEIYYNAYMWCVRITWIKRSTTYLQADRKNGLKNATLDDYAEVKNFLHTVAQ